MLRNEVVPRGIKMMARVERRRAQNAPGLFFVDVTCIDCGTCRWMAPDTFAQRGGKSAVVHQPENRAAQTAFRALVSCPVGAIGAPGTAAVVEEVAASFPVPVEDNVYHCGFHSPLSHGAASWFIRRERGNYLVDSPRFTEPLVSRLGISAAWRACSSRTGTTLPIIAAFDRSSAVNESSTRTT